MAFSRLLIDRRSLVLVLSWLFRVRQIPLVGASSCFSVVNSGVYHLFNLLLVLNVETAIVIASRMLVSTVSAMVRVVVAFSKASRGISRRSMWISNFCQFHQTVEERGVGLGG